VTAPTCLPRRRVLAAALCAGAGAATPASAQQKWSRAEAEYQDTRKDGQTCGLCTRYRTPASCEVVEGATAREGWCKFFDMVD
jgi:hypothetical protein